MFIDFFLILFLVLVIIFIITKVLYFTKCKNKKKQWRDVGIIFKQFANLLSK